MNDQARIQISGLRTVGVPVTDQDRALEFYVGALGFDKRLDAAYGSGGRWVEVAPPGSVVTIALVRSSEHVPAGVETGIRLTSADANADHAALLARGVDVDPEVLRWPGAPPMFAFRDQDANRLEIVESAGGA
jgi:catechol 2,3-dioxygenase-like lactoylglutathione lyase family enzyme